MTPHNRRAEDNFQTTVLIELGDIKALCATNAGESKALNGRVTSLEKTNTRQWWLHGIQGMLVGLFGLARKFGVI